MNKLGRNLTLISLVLLCLIMAAACQPPPASPSPPVPGTQASLPATIPPLAETAQPANPSTVSPGVSPTGSAAPSGEPSQLTLRNRLANGAITGAPAYSADGSLFVVPTAAGVYLHDGITLEERAVIPAPASLHGLAVLSPDNRLLAIERPGGVGLYRVTDGSLIQEFAASPGSLATDLAISPDGQFLTAGFDDGVVSVWSLPGGVELASLPGSLLEFSPDSQLLATVELEKQRVRLYSTQDWSEQGAWSGEAALFSPTGSLGIQAGEAFRLVDPATGQAVQAFNGTLPAFSPDGGLLALYSLSRLQLYEPSSGERLQTLEGEYAGIQNLSFSPDGQNLAAATIVEMCPGCQTTLGPLAVWRVLDGRLVQTIEGFNFAPWLAFDPQSVRLAAVETDRLQFFDPLNGEQVDELEKYVHGVLGLAFSPDGQQLATFGYPSDSARLWQVNDASLAKELEDAATGNNWFGGNLAFNPDGEILAVGSDMWALPAGNELHQLEQKLVDTYSLMASGVAFSPDGNSVVLGFLGGGLDLWDLASQSLVQSLKGYTGEVTGLSYSTDGSMLASVFGYPDFTVQVWEMPAGEPIQSFQGAQFFQAVFSPEGDRLATLAASDEYLDTGWKTGAVQIWDLSSGQLRVELPVEDAVSLAFFPDGDLLATGSFDGTLRVWTVQDGRLLQSVPAHFSPAYGLAFSPDGSLLASGAEDGSLFLWNLPGR